MPSGRFFIGRQLCDPLAVGLLCAQPPEVLKG